MLTLGRQRAIVGLLARRTAGRFAFMVDLRLGEHLAIVADLQALVAQHPLQEQLVEMLLLALYRSGRQSDALNVHATTRQRLDDQLGVEPGACLQQLRLRILRADDDLVLDMPSTGARIPVDLSAHHGGQDTKRSGTWRAPTQLPCDIAEFTGRTSEVAGLAAPVVHYGHRDVGPAGRSRRCPTRPPAVVGQP